MTSRETDDFWDIGALLPKKKTAPAPSRPFAIAVSPALVESGKETPPSPACALHFDLPEGQTNPEERVYIPKGNMLLSEVRLARTESRYHFYSHFLTDAKLAMAEKGKKCDYVPFFSYLPQHGQLSAAQRAYYLYFRNEVNVGRYPETNQSYFLLYVFEILNLPDVISPEVGVKRLASLWAAYRHKLPQEDKFMAEWLMDYCLVHNLPCPGEILSPFLSDILPMAAVKEFYLDGGADSPLGKARSVIALSSDYDPQKSRLAQGEDKAFYSSCVTGAVSAVLSRMEEEGASALRGRPAVKTFDAFLGALCAWPARERITLSYFPVSDTPTLRQTVTATLKYAENKVRAYKGIKSRLTVPPFPEKYQAAVDDFLRKAIPEKVPPLPQRPAYESLYDAKETAFSPRDAADIERLSWQNTRLLLPEEEGEGGEEIVCAMQKAADTSAAPKEDSASSDAVAPDCATDSGQNSYGLSASEIAFLRAVFVKESEKARQIARKAGKTEESMAEHINECFADTMGDIVLCMEEGGISVLADYEEEVADLLSPENHE